MGAVLLLDLHRVVRSFLVCVSKGLPYVTVVDTFILKYIDFILEVNNNMGNRHTWQQSRSWSENDLGMGPAGPCPLAGGQLFLE